jgi:hypothetical protein
VGAKEKIWNFTYKYYRYISQFQNVNQTNTSFLQWLIGSSYLLCYFLLNPPPLLTPCLNPIGVTLSQKYFGGCLKGATAQGIKILEYHLFYTSRRAHLCDRYFFFVCCDRYFLLCKYK